MQSWFIWLVNELYHEGSNTPSSEIGSKQHKLSVRHLEAVAKVSCLNLCPACITAYILPFQCIFFIAQFGTENDERGNFCWWHAFVAGYSFSFYLRHHELLRFSFPPKLQV